ncbi:low molecular weight phosphatase family protein [Ectothiorhodospira lacustris]|uniref:arsenate-mycothiol transferase ArsC n=1 Tax=Ectothiorhodospira lacustris TaxID=2899127 RepID=UPI001EE8D2B1|nr:arsenate reductase ArsC [Ectothiorhodospira lacustris]MCG5501111.1 arsenate reductase ArsC [Ectothiorhodospira lacustris]MCG5510833.1 arsenate reductase ArsC [Ectothiorhodospira lacustris]MCG5522621.1 arsenate reductase ArsC [Ectothiorhodospira lacustris]
MTNASNLRRKPHILFLGPTNTARTLMAEACARAYLADLAEVRSVGMRAGDPDDRTLAVLEEDGTDTSALRPRDLDAAVLEWADLIVTLTPDPTRLPAPRGDSFISKNWPLDDPRMQGDNGPDLDAYRRCREEIKRRVRQLANSIRLMQR